MHPDASYNNRVEALAQLAPPEEPYSLLIPPVGKPSILIAIGIIGALVLGTAAALRPATARVGTVHSATAHYPPTSVPARHLPSVTPIPLAHGATIVPLPLARGPVVTR